MIKKTTAEDLVEVVSFLNLGQGESWPLSGPQILPYFDASQATDIYNMIDSLISDGVGLTEIGKMFRRPTYLRYFFTHNAIIGLKVANAIKMKSTTIEERTNYIQNLLDVLPTMVSSDPLCRDGKNLVLDDNQIKMLLGDTYWTEIDEKNKKIFSILGVDMFTYAWSLYYNLFVATGFEIHGPYDIKNSSGEYKLIIRENFNLDSGGIWPIDNKFKNLKLMFLFDKDCDYSLNYYNQPDISTNINQRLKYAAVMVDGQCISHLGTVETLSKKLEEISSEVANHINNLTDIDRVRKGAEISYFMFEGLFTRFNENWKILANKATDATLSRFGDKFIKQNKFRFHIRTTKEWQDLFDPRNDYLGEIELH